MDTMMIINICKALGSPIRLEILQQLVNGEKCACHLLECFAITQPTLSHHMRILCTCGLVQDHKDGKWHYYSLNKNNLRLFGNFFVGLGITSDNPCDCCESGGKEHE